MDKEKNESLEIGVGQDYGVLKPEPIADIPVEAEHSTEREAIQTWQTRPSTHVPGVEKQPAGAGTIVLQWLTYAFWGWTLLALNWLIYIVLASFMSSANMSSYIPYAVAATLVLLPISLVCDVFYARREPTKKTGAATIVMVIHAVIFALCGIGSLIGAVLLVVQYLVNTPADTASTNSWILTLFVSAVLYAVTFLRTLNPWPSLKLAKKFEITMLILVTLLLVGTFIGPVARASVTKDDRDIVTYLSYVSTGINSYVNKNSELPNSLTDVSFSSPGADDIIKRNLVAYSKEDVSNQSKVASNNYDDSTRTYYRYQLCVSYKEKSSDSSFSSYESTNQNEYESYLSVYSHPAGRVCYKLEASTKGQTQAQQQSLSGSVDTPDTTKYDTYATVATQLTKCNVDLIQTVKVQATGRDVIYVRLTTAITRPDPGTGAQASTTDLFLSYTQKDMLSKDLKTANATCKQTVAWLVNSVNP